MSTSAASATNAAAYHSARRVRAERRGTHKRYTRRIWGLTIPTCNEIVNVAPSGTPAGGRVGQTPSGDAARAPESPWPCLPLRDPRGCQLRVLGGVAAGEWGG